MSKPVTLTEEEFAALVEVFHYHAPDELDDLDIARESGSTRRHVGTAWEVLDRLLTRVQEEESEP